MALSPLVSSAIERLSHKIRDAFSVGGNVDTSLNDIENMPDVNLQTADRLARALIPEIVTLVQSVVLSGDSTNVVVNQLQSDLAEIDTTSAQHILNAVSTSLRDSEQLVRNNPENPTYGRVGNIVPCTKSFHNSLVANGEEDPNTVYLIIDLLS